MIHLSPNDSFIVTWLFFPLTIHIFFTWLIYHHILFPWCHFRCITRWKKKEKNEHSHMIMYSITHIMTWIITCEMQAKCKEKKRVRVKAWKKRKRKRRRRRTTRREAKDWHALFNTSSELLSSDMVGPLVLFVHHHMLIVRIKTQNEKKWNPLHNFTHRI